MSEPEPAFVIRRVSGSDQDEQLRNESIARYLIDHNLYEAGHADLKGYSASKGEQQEAQDASVAGIENGSWRHVVVWAGDRAERRGGAALLAYVGRIKKAGGTFHSEQEPWLSQMPAFSDTMTALVGDVAYEEVKRKTARLKDGLDKRKNFGGARGKLSWGMTRVGAKYQRQTVLTDVGREWAPRIFEWAAAGQSGRDIARRLTESAVPTAKGKSEWKQSSVIGILRNPAYYGVDRDGNACEPAVTQGLWDSAQIAVSSRYTADPETDHHPRSKRKLKHEGEEWGSIWIANAVGCGWCGKPMRHDKGGKRRSVVLSCEHCNAPAIPGDLAVDAVDAAMAQLDFMPVLEFRRVPGNALQLQAAKAKVDAELLRLPSLRLSRPDEQARREKLWAELDEIEQAPRISDSRKLVRTGETYASRWERLSPRERREFLTRGEFTVYLSRGQEMPTEAEIEERRAMDFKEMISHTKSIGDYATARIIWEDNDTEWDAEE